MALLGNDINDYYNRDKYWGIIDKFYFQFSYRTHNENRSKKFNLKERAEKDDPKYLKLIEKINKEKCKQKKKLSQNKN